MYSESTYKGYFSFRGRAVPSCPKCQPPLECVETSLGARGVCPECDGTAALGTGPAVPETSGGAAPELESFWDDQLIELETVLAGPGLSSVVSSPSSSPRRSPAPSRSRSRAERRPRRAGQASPQTSWVAWFGLAVGCLAFACGSLLVGWSRWADHPQLETWGLPLTLGGQVFLLFGVVLQLESYGAGQRQVVRMLRQVKADLQRLERRAVPPGTAPTVPGRSCFVPGPERASPRLLLDELKGQLDRLALRLAEQESTGQRE